MISYLNRLAAVVFVGAIGLLAPVAGANAAGPSSSANLALVVPGLPFLAPGSVGFVGPSVDPGAFAVIGPTVLTTGAGNVFSATTITTSAGSAVVNTGPGAS
jgi:hypothetical protein